MCKRVLYLGTFCDVIKILSSKEKEIIGFVFGEEKNSQVFPKVLIMIRNISRRPKFEFLSEPFDVIVAHNVAEYYNLELVAIVHSHPQRSGCKPSLKDIKNMKLWPVIWIIASLDCISAYKLLNDEKLLLYKMVC